MSLLTKGLNETRVAIADLSGQIASLMADQNRAEIRYRKMRSSNKKYEGTYNLIQSNKILLTELRRQKKIMQDHERSTIAKLNRLPIPTLQSATIKLGPTEKEVRAFQSFIKAPKIGILPEFVESDIAIIDRPQSNLSAESVIRSIDEVRELRDEIETSSIYYVKMEPIAKVIKSIQLGKNQRSILDTLVLLSNFDSVDELNQDQLKIIEDFATEYSKIDNIGRSIARVKHFNVKQIMDAIIKLEDLLLIEFDTDAIKAALLQRKALLHDFARMDQLMTIYASDPYKAVLFFSVGAGIYDRSFSNSMIDEIVQGYQLDIEEFEEYIIYTYYNGRGIFANIIELNQDDIMEDTIIAMLTKIRVNNGDIISLSAKYKEIMREDDKFFAFKTEKEKRDDAIMSVGTYSANIKPRLYFMEDKETFALTSDQIVELAYDLKTTILAQLKYESDGYKIYTIAVYIIPSPEGGCKHMETYIPHQLINVSPEENNDCLFDCINALGHNINADDTRKTYKLKPNAPISIHMAKRICEQYKIPISCATTANNISGHICLFKDHYFLTTNIDRTIFRKLKNDRNSMMYVFFDIESMGKIVQNSKGQDERDQVPIIYGYKICILRNGKIASDDDEFHNLTDKFATKFNYTKTFGDLLKMVCYLTVKGKYKGKILFVAFNGSKYDNILALADLFTKTTFNNGIEIKFGDACIHNNSIIKCPITVHWFGKKMCDIDFLDLAKFMTGSLAFNLQSYKCNILKGDFDTTKLNCTLDELTVEMRADLLKYLQSDVLGLEELYLKKAEIFKDLIGNEMYNYVSTSNATYSKFQSTPDSKNILLMNSIDDDNFCRQAIYGANCKVFIRKFDCNDPNDYARTQLKEVDVNDNYIVPLDCNGLYPYAMTFDMPCGKYKRFSTENMLSEEYNKLITEIKTEKIGCIMLVFIHKSPKDIVYPWFPRRDANNATIFDLKDNERSYMAGPQYNDMIRYGFDLEILEIIIWPQMKPSLKKYIKSMYELRTSYKCKMAEAKRIGDEFQMNYCDSMQNEIKLMMNGLYGKFCQKPIFTKTKIEQLGKDTREYIHGKYLDSKLGSLSFIGDYSVVESTEFNIKSCSKPSYIGAYILAYSKRIMLSLFEELDVMKKPNSLVYYCDTDSAYVHISLAKKIKQTSILGGFKNDYGEDMKVIEAYFLAPKMKACRKTLSTTDTGCHLAAVNLITMKGISKFKSDRKTESITFENFKQMYTDGKPLIIDGQLKFTKTCINKTEAKMFGIRVNDNVQKEIKISHMLDKYQLINDRFYPLQYRLQ